MVAGEGGGGVVGDAERDGKGVTGCSRDWIGSY